MKIVHWIKQFYPYMGGGETALYELCRQIENEKDITENVIITTRLKGTLKTERLFKKTTIHRIGRETDYNNDRGFRLFFKTTLRDLLLYSELKKHVTKDTVIHIHGPMPVPLIFRKAKKLFSWSKNFRPWENFDVPVIMHYHAKSLIDRQWLVKRDYMTSDALIYVDRSIGNDFSGKNKAVFIPNGIDLSKFKPGNAKRKYITFIGRIYSAKGWKTFVEAVKEIKNTLVIGHGEEEEKLKERFSGKFIGSVKNEDLPKYYNESSVVVCPYEHIGFTRVAMEAMACGCILIKSDYDPEYYPLKNCENGFIFRTGDSQDLKSALLKIKKLDSNSLDNLRKNAVITARKNFDIKKLSKKIITQYYNVFELRRA